MLIIEVQALENGARRNQTADFQVVPEGYIAVPPALEVEARQYLPFIDLTIEGGVLIAVAQGTIPEPEPEPAPEATQLDRVEAQAIYTALLTDTLIEEGA